MRQLVWASMDFGPLRGLLYVWLWLWVVTHPVKVRALLAAGQQGRLYDVVRGTDLFVALSTTRPRRTRRLNHDGRHHDLRIERVSYLEAWLTRQSSDYIASVTVDHAPRKDGVWGGFVVSWMGPFKHRRDAWRAAEQYVMTGDHGESTTK